jgi:hypothetical protein
MRKYWLISALIMLIGITIVHADISLQEVFIQADGYAGYDKYIELDADSIYIGDLYIPEGLRVFIDGHGAMINGLPYYTSIHVWGSLLDVSHCVIYGGYNGIVFDTLSAGTINSNTVVGCNNIGITVLYQDLSDDAEIWDNIVTDCDVGFLCLENWHPRYIGYNTIYGMEVYRYAELCPD